MGRWITTFALRPHKNTTSRVHYFYQRQMITQKACNIKIRKSCYSPSVWNTSSVNVIPERTIFEINYWRKMYLVWYAGGAVTSNRISYASPTRGDLRPFFWNFDRRKIENLTKIWRKSMNLAWFFTCGHENFRSPNFSSTTRSRGLRPSLAHFDLRGNTF